MPWFSKKDKQIEAVPPEERVVKTENVFVKCEACEAHLYKRELEEGLQVCIHCGYHFRIGARERLAMLFDDAKFEELDAEVISIDPLEFVDTKPYPTRLKQARKGSGALKEHGAVVIFATSGGARMQEGALSLMQMAKISAALAELDEARLPFVSILTDPTTGGVTASFAMLGDFIIAEPKALIGFAGPRVIEQTIRQKLPKDFQKSEFLLEHGMVDAIVDRREMRDYIIKLLNFMMNPEISSTSEIERLRTRATSGK